jgi:hypothetical protein
MAELVDALVSKTSGVIPVPVRSRLRVQKPVLSTGFLHLSPYLFSSPDLLEYYLDGLTYYLNFAPQKRLKT